VKIQGQLTEVLGIEKGLKQGDALSTTLQYCTGEDDKEYRDQSEWNNF
jgi:hypothetical protein